MVVLTLVGNAARASPSPVDSPTGVAPTIVDRGGHYRFQAGDWIFFDLRVAGSEPLDWRWTFNGQPLASDGQLAVYQGVLEIPIASPSRAGVYQLVVRNPFGVVRSGEIVIDVQVPPPPEIEPPSGTYDDLVMVRTPDPPIWTVYRYTLDGRQPDPSRSPIWPGSRSLAWSANLTIQAFAAGEPLWPPVTREYVVTAPDPPAPPPDGRLLAHWRFDASDTTELPETTGWYPATRSPTGTRLVPEGVSGDAIEFDPMFNGHVLAEFFPSLAGRAYSVSVWVQAPPGSLPSVASVFSQYVPNATAGLHLALNADGWSVSAMTGPVEPAWNRAGYAGTLDDGRWHHLVLTRSTTGDTRLHVDGGPPRDRVLAEPISPSSARTVIGGIDSVTPRGTFRGRIDELQIYDFVLGTDQVNRLFISPGDDLGLPPVPRPGPPRIDVQPDGLEVPEGASGSLGVAASGTAPFRYQWWFQGTRISGATNASLEFPVATSLPGGVYRVEVSNRGGTVWSRRVTVNVGGGDHYPHGFAIEPRDQLVDSGAPVRFDAIPGGSDPVAYQWFLGDDPIPDATDAVLELDAVNLTDAGEYHVRIGNAEGRAWSRVAQLAVREPSAPEILKPSGTTVAFEGQTLRFDPTVQGTRPLRFRWFKDDVPLADATEASLVLPVLTLEDSGVYRVLVSNALDSAMSPPWIVVVHPRPVVGFDPEGGEFDAPPRVTLTSSVAGPEIRYTLDGSEPGPDSTHYAGPIVLDPPTTVTAAPFFAGQRVGEIRTAAYRLRPERVLEVCAPPSVIEGGRCRLAIHLSGGTEVHSGAIALRFPEDAFAEPSIIWNPALVATWEFLGRIDPGKILLHFSAEFSVPISEELCLAEIDLRAQGVPEARSVPLELEVSDLRDRAGAPLLDGTEARGTHLPVLPRSRTGDNNANERLDVGDATVMVRLLRSTPAPSPWQIGANDLDRNGELGVEDVRLVLDAVVAETTSTPATGPSSTRTSSDAGLPSGALPRLFRLGLDRPMAPVGDLLTVRVDLIPLSTPPAAASFRIQYPTGVLRPTNHQVPGAADIEPATGFTLATTSGGTPTTAETGVIRWAACSDLNWSPDGGTVATWTFRIEPSALEREAWEIRLDQVEFTLGGYDLAPAGATSANFRVRPRMPPVLREFALGTEGSFVIRCNAVPGEHLRLETSEDLSIWTPGPVEIVDTEGNCRLEDTAAKGGHRFYRVVVTEGGAPP